jgi:hypothetical protein
MFINLGGEDEVPGVLNQQPPFALGPSWRSQDGRTIAEMTAAGIPFVICANDALPFSDESHDEVYTRNVPIDTIHLYYGLGVQSSEIRRILKPGGRWIHTDSFGQVTIWVKPV